MDPSRTDDILQRYLQLRTAAEKQTSILFDTYRSEVKCAKGCSECCDDISVLPIEWYLLRKWLTEQPRELLYYGENRCPFLHKADGSCSIYAMRPIICRIHGLPIRHTVEEYDVNGQKVFHEPLEYTYSWCELNFEEYDPNCGAESFAPDGFINMEAWTRSLKKLNSEFLAALHSGEIPENAGLFSLSTLVE